MSPRPQRLEGVEAMTFDCYGTLIDWQGGAKRTLQALLARAGAKHPFRTEALNAFFQAWERAQRTRLAPGYRRYRDIVAEAFAEVARAQGLPLDPDDARDFATAIPTWTPFPDTVAALRSLKRRLRLGIISNIDDDILAQTVKLLQVPFDLLMTAQQAGAYKPALAPFERALERLALPPARVAHAAFGFEYDITTASALGFRTVLVRRGRKHFPPTPSPNFAVADLAELASHFA